MPKTLLRPTYSCLTKTTLHASCFKMLHFASKFKTKEEKTDSVLKWPQNVHFKNTLKWCAECDNINQNVCKFEMCSNDTGFWCPKRTQLESFVSEDKSTRIFGTLNSHWISYHRETNNKQPSIYHGCNRRVIGESRYRSVKMCAQCSVFTVQNQNTINTKQMVQCLRSHRTCLNRFVCISNQIRFEMTAFVFGRAERTPQTFDGSKWLEKIWTNAEAID